MPTLKTPGTLDPDFNAGAAQTIYPSGIADAAHSVLPLADGALLVAAASSASSNFSINRINADGSLPAPEAFGNQTSPRGYGYLLDSFGSSRPTPQLLGYSGGAFHVLNLQADGVHMARYTAAGQEAARYRIGLEALPDGAVAQGPMFSAAQGERVYSAFTVRLSTGETLAAVLCFTAQGQLDAAFNGTGLALVHVPDAVTRSSQVRGLGVQRHGADAGKLILAGGWAANSTEEGAFVTRLSVNGELDLAFGEAGFAWVEADQYRYLQLVVDPSDNFKVCGSVRDRGTSPRTREVAIAWTAQGKVDQAFGGVRVLLETIPVAGTEARGKVVFDARGDGEGYRLACVKYFNTTTLRLAALNGAGQMDQAMGRVQLRPGNMGNDAGGVLGHDAQGRMLVGWGVSVFRLLGE